MTKTVTPPRNLRAEMPLVTAFIDDLRAVFGVEEINAQIKKGMAGIPGFYAEENGHRLGTPQIRRGTEVSGADMVLESIQREKENNAHRNPRR